MNPQFFQYESRFRELAQLEQDELPRSLRLFNIRVRLALDIQIDFEGQISLTKSKPVRDTYVLLVQLMEMWNAYEALSHYGEHVGPYVSAGVGKSRIYTQKLLKEVGSMKTLSDSLSRLTSESSSNETFRQDFKQYVQRIEQDSKLSRTLKNDAKSVLKHVSEQGSISGIEILSLIYAERNMYYHNGETAKLGMRYSNRQKLLQRYKSTLTDHTLMLATYFIDRHISQAV